MDADDSESVFGELFNDWCNDSAKDETVIDEFGEMVPVINKMYKAIKIYTSVRDYMFRRKIESFIFHFYSLPKSTIDSIKSELKRSPEQAQRIGEHVLAILESYNDLQKARLLAELLAALMSKYIDFIEFKRLSHAINIAYVDDTERLISTEVIPDDMTDWMGALAGSGLSYFHNDGTWKGVDKFKISQIGQKFRDAIRTVREGRDF